MHYIKPLGVYCFSLVLIGSTLSCGGHGTGSGISMPPPVVRPGSLNHAPLPSALKPLQLQLEQLMYAQGDLVNAEQVAKELLTRDPNIALAHEVLGFISILKGNSSDERTHFEKALLDGAEPNGYYYLIRMLPDYSDVENVKRNIEVLKQVEAYHPNHHLRLFAAHYLARELRKLGKIEEAKFIQQQRQMIAQWSIIGGFDNDQNRGFLSTYPPEKSIALDAQYEGQRWRVNWRKNPIMNWSGMVNLKELIKPDHWNVAYLLTYVYSPTPQEAKLYLSSSDACRTWLNDRLIMSHPYINAPGVDNVVANIALHQGWNKLLLKSAQRTGAWQMGARLAALSGEPISGLKFSATTQPYPPDIKKTPHSPEKQNLIIPDILPNTLTKERRIFLSALMAKDVIHHRQLSSKYIDQLAQQTSESPLLWFFGGLVYWSDEQQNKVANYLRKGVEKYGNTYPAFLVKRAHWFNEHNQWREATRLLNQALALKPHRSDWKLILAQQYGAKRWHEEQAHLLQQIIHEHPTQVNTYKELGDCWRQLGRNNQARQVYLQGLKYSPGNLLIHQHLRDLSLRMGKLDEAITWAKEIISLDPTATNSYIQLGDIYRQAEKTGLAEKFYQQASSLTPEWSKPYLRLGALAFEGAQKAKAIEWWRKALTYTPDNNNLWERLEQIAPAKEFILSAFVPTESMVLTELQKLKQEEYPSSASQVYLIDAEVSQWLENGAARSIVTAAQKILDEQARDSLGEITLPGNGHLQLNFAFVLDADGNRTDVSSIQHRKLIFPKLKVGSTIVYQYIRHERNDGFLQNERLASWFFQSANAFHRRSHFTLITPQRTPLHVFIQGKVKRHEKMITAENRRWRINTFTAHNMPPLIPEGMNRHPTYYLAKIVVSTYHDWESQAKWIRSMFDEAIQVTPEIKQLAFKLAPSHLSIPDRIRAIYQFMVEKIRYEQDYAFKIEGVKPHQAAMVLQHGYGDCKDKTILLISLLKAIGVKAYYSTLLTTNYGPVYTDVPGNQFNHAIVYLPVQQGVEQATFLDSTAQYLELDNVRPDDQGALAFVIDSKSYQFIAIPYDHFDNNFTKIEVDLDLTNHNTPSAMLKFSARGLSAGMFRHAMANRGLSEQVVRNSVSSLLYADATVEKFTTSEATDISHPFTIEATFSSSGLVQRKERKFDIQPPNMIPKLSLGKWTQRHLPLYLSIPSSLETVLRIKLPAGYKYRKTANNNQYSERHGCLDYSQEITKEKDVLLRKEKLQWSCAEISVEQYPNFKSFWDKIMNRSMAPLTIER